MRRKPIEPEPLPPQDVRVCIDCGVAVANPTHLETLTASAREIAHNGQVIKIDENTAYEYNLTRDYLCLARMERAENLIAAYPRIARRLGGHAYAVDTIDNALIALDALGIEGKHTAKFVATERDVMLLTQYLVRAGSLARWSQRLVPVTRAWASVDQHSPSRWAHLTEAQWTELRRAYADFLAARIDARTKVAPPGDGARGCLLCGVSHVDAKPSERGDVWGRLRKANPGQLGGRIQPKPVLGYTCPVCTITVEKVGGLGPTALEQALMTFLGVQRHTYAEIGLEGVRAWAALPEGAAPNRTPWEHEPDHAELTKMLENA